MVSAVYQILNQSNGKRYIGSSVDVKYRWRRHLVDLRRGRHCNPHLQGAFCKHGEGAFLYSVLEQVVPERLIGREQHYFDMLKPEYNIAPVAGSQLGLRHTDEARKKMSDAKRGNRHPMYGKHPNAEACARMSMAQSGERHPMYGKHLNAETRKKISQALVGRQRSKEHCRKLSEVRRGKRHPMYGKHHSNETKRKLSEALTGRHPSEETRRKMSEAKRGKAHPHIGHQHSEQSKQKMREARKAYWRRVRAAEGAGG